MTRHDQGRPPGRIPLVDPTEQARCAAAFDEVEQSGGPAPAGQAHDAGDEAGRAGRGGGLERGLVHPDRIDAGQPVRVVHPGGAVLADRGHRGAPTDPELPGLRVPETPYTSCHLPILVEQAADAVVSFDLADVGGRGLGEWSCGSCLPECAVWTVIV
jgi:hypothetical protein